MSGKIDSPASSKSPWICCAVREEIEFFGPVHAQVILTGMGPRSARLAFQTAFAREQPSLVLSCGFAGGLNPAFAVGTILFSADDSFPWTAQLARAGAVPGRFHCSDRVICLAAEKMALWHSTGADAVEMESHVIRSLCREHQIPSATVRVISDGAREDLPVDFNRLLTPGGRLHAGRLFLDLLRKPRSVADLLRLRRQTRTAARLLADVLHRLVGAHKSW